MAVLCGYLLRKKYHTPNRNMAGDKMGTATQGLQRIMNPLLTLNFDEPFNEKTATTMDWEPEWGLSPDFIPKATDNTRVGPATTKKTTEQPQKKLDRAISL